MPWEFADLGICYAMFSVSPGGKILWICRPMKTSRVIEVFSLIQYKVYSLSPHIRRGRQSLDLKIPVIFPRSGSWNGIRNTVACLLGATSLLSTLGKAVDWAREGTNWGLSKGKCSWFVMRLSFQFVTEAKSFRRERSGFLQSTLLSFANFGS